METKTILKKISNIKPFKVLLPWWLITFAFKGYFYVVNIKTWKYRSAWIDHVTRWRRGLPVVWKCLYLTVVIKNKRYYFPPLVSKGSFKTRFVQPCGENSSLIISETLWMTDLLTEAYFSLNVTWTELILIVLIADLLIFYLHDKRKTISWIKRIKIKRRNNLIFLTGKKNVKLTLTILVF